MSGPDRRYPVVAGRTSPSRLPFTLLSLRGFHVDGGSAVGKGGPVGNNAGTYALVENREDRPLVVLLVDTERDAEEIAIELRRNGRPIEVRPYRD
jgi:hypothetical protein